MDSTHHFVNILEWAVAKMVVLHLILKVLYIMPFYNLKQKKLLLYLIF